MDEDTCGWQQRVGVEEGGGLSKQPSRVGEVSQREEKSEEPEIKGGKKNYIYVYKVRVEDFLKSWRNSQMSFFRLEEKWR